MISNCSRLVDRNEIQQLKPISIANHLINHFLFSFPLTLNSSLSEPINVILKQIL
jgi:hypothetical protein